MDATIGIILDIIQVKVLHHNITKTRHHYISKPPITLIILCNFYFFILLLLYSSSNLSPKKLTLHKDNNNKHENQPKQFKTLDSCFFAHHVHQHNHGQQKKKTYPFYPYCCCCFNNFDVFLLIKQSNHVWVFLGNYGQHLL
jgi:hypothetical protein